MLKSPTYSNNLIPALLQCGMVLPPEMPCCHSHLDVPEFHDLNPTAENIAVVIWNKLRDKINPELDLEVTLYETPRNFVTYKGE